MTSITLPSRACTKSAGIQPSCSTRVIRAGLLGCGTVGRAVVHAIGRHRRWLERVHGIRLEFAAILVRDPSRDRGINRKLFTTNARDVTEASPDVVIEALGGVHPAAEYVAAALRKGVPVVTANKSLVAREGERLTATARRHGTSLYCEASVGGAVPVLAAIRQMNGDRVHSIRAILNGTCNFILTRMSEERVPFNDAVAEAIARGLAEPDPTADLSGMDSAEKLCVLAAALGFRAHPDDIDVQGIEHVTCDDILAARRHGYAVKQVADLAAEPGEHAALRVGPTLVPRAHPLARVRNEDNIFMIDCELAGAITVQGKGAGPEPTAAAIIGDVLQAVRGDPGTMARHTPTAFPSFGHGPAAITPLFVRFDNATNPLSPARLLNALNIHGIEASHVDFRTDSCELRITTGSRTHVAAALRSIGKSETTTFIAPILE